MNNKPVELTSNGQFGKSFEYIPPKLKYLNKIKVRKK